MQPSALTDLLLDVDILNKEQVITTWRQIRATDGPRMSLSLTPFVFRSHLH